MNRTPYTLLAPALLILLGSLTGGCGSESQSTTGWTVNEGALTLDRTLLVSETDSFYFGSIADVAVDSDGHAYVLDWDATHVKVIGPDGGLRDSLGGKGQGPGEFQRPRNAVTARGDSLYVLDPRSSRISVFAPSNRFAYSVQVEYDGLAENLLVPDAHSGFLLSHTSLPSPDAPETGSFLLQRVSSSGSTTDTLLTAAPRELEPVKTDEFRALLGVPFGRQPHVALGPKGRIHFGRNDSLRVIPYSLQGSPATSTPLPFTPVPISDEERKERLKRVLDGSRGSIRDAMPSTKPAFNHFLVDDEGRYWFGRPTANSDSTAWWVALPDEKRVATTTLSSETEILAVKNGRAYGRTTTEMGAPALVRYDIGLER